MDLPDYVDALEQTLRATLALVEGLSVDEWGLATRCPGWDVHDQVAHVVGLEAQSLGEPVPPEAPAAPHVRDAVGAHMERAVHRWRGRPDAELVAELRRVVGPAVAALRGLGAHDEVGGPTGELRPVLQSLPIRVFDRWAHEQDIREAVGRAGDLDSPAALVAQQQVLAVLPFVVAKRAGAGPGQSVGLEVTGELPTRVLVAVSDDGRAQVVPEGDPATATARLTLSWRDLAARACGRQGAESTPVDVAGDVELAGRVLEAMAITP